MSDLLNKKECGWNNLTEEKRGAIFQFCDGYIQFLNNVKTEREANKRIISDLKIAGFRSIDDIQILSEGDKVYLDNRGKGVFAVVIGREKLTDGINMIGAHIDSPRLDLKPNPVYEDCKLGLFKTHYYGGIKKYQWTTIPLAIHGVIVKANGEKQEIMIGEDDGDPIFTITDILPHLSQKQYEKTLSKSRKGINSLGKALWIFRKAEIRS